MLRRLAESTIVHVGLISGAIALLTISAVRMAAFEPLELRFYDLMMRSRPVQPPDPRLLIVTVTEADLQALKVTTPSDRTLAQTIQTLQKHKPRVIGVDFYRDLPQGEGQAELKQQLKADNVTIIHRIGESHEEQIPAPPEIPPERIGFNDLAIDGDGVLRRALIFANQETSFALQNAFIYLEKDKIFPEESPTYPGILKLGQSTFLPLSENAGAYRTADAKGHQILLNYRSATVAPHLTLSQVLHQRFNPNQVKDKIVLIGSTAISGNDFFYTPYSPSQNQHHKMSGIEAQAQIISQILDAAMGQRSLIHYLPSWTEWLWIAGWTLAGGFLAWRVRYLPLLGALETSLLLTVVSSGFLALNQGVWLPIVAPTVGAIASPVCVISYRIQKLQRQNRMAMTLLGQNTSAKVAKALWKNRHTLVQSGKLPGQLVTATMLFADLQGFSSMSEKLPPEALMNWLNEYLSAMSDAVTCHDGIVNKFTGDGLFAVFGVPIPRTEESAIAADAQNAVDCAIAMSQQLDLLNQTWLEQGLGTFQMRIGICTGAAVVGSLGSKERTEYGVIGDAVNIASRLESCAKERQPSLCRILVSESTQRYLSDRIPLEAWGALELSGKQQSVNAYRIVSPVAPA